MIMDFNYSWNQPEHTGPAQKIWSKVLNDTSKEKIINQNHTNFPFFLSNEIPIFSSFSPENPSKIDCFHNPPIKIDDLHESRDEKARQREEIFINQLIQLVRQKREYNKGSTFGYALQIELGMLSTEEAALCPWRVLGTQRGEGGLREYARSVGGLSEELGDFYRYIQPTEEEHCMREAVVCRLRAVVLQEWPEAVVDVFGSFKTELNLPTSDIDVVIFGKWDNPLWKLNDIIKRSGIASDCKVLDKATVPIVKMTDRESDVRIDISFNMDNGIKSAQLIKSYINQYPQLPQLVLVLKQYLLQRDLNEVWTGGISSYSLILMCVGFLKHCTKTKIDISNNLGQTLILFLEMYGRNFDYSNTAIRTEGDVSYVPKEEIMKNMDGSQWSSILCIEDPLNPGNDIGRSSYGALHVKLAFDYAYKNLAPVVLSQSSHLFTDCKSILGRIIRITPEVIKYRAFIKEKYSKINIATKNIAAPPTHAQVLTDSIIKDRNTNNSYHKTKNSIVSERGDVPSNKQEAVQLSSNQIKTLSYNNNNNSNNNTNNYYKKSVAAAAGAANHGARGSQVRVSALNELISTSQHHHHHRNTSSEQVPSKQFKKSTVIFNCATNRN